MKKFRIEVDERQLRVICAALDMYARLGMGQWEILAEFLARYFQISTVFAPYEYTYARIMTWVNALKRDAFNLDANASNGIYNEAVPVDCREAYDIRQVLAKVTARPGHVDSRSYMPANEDWPPVTCAELED